MLRAWKPQQCEGQIRKQAGVFWGASVPDAACRRAIRIVPMPWRPRSGQGTDTLLAPASRRENLRREHPVAFAYKVV
jgi:hypothetical protein